ncbi:hypothetical protein [Mesorhizobium shangrilense]|uniref:Uncharacterized protein n=1 Tax=Mesorhizobium shangrilense TaxID=460060 RepID=A0ABV2DFR4_9HYPH
MEEKKNFRARILHEMSSNYLILLIYIPWMVVAQRVLPVFVVKVFRCVAELMRAQNWHRELKEFERITLSRSRQQFGSEKPEPCQRPCRPELSVYRWIQFPSLSS